MSKISVILRPSVEAGFVNPRDVFGEIFPRDAASLHQAIFRHPEQNGGVVHGVTVTRELVKTLLLVNDDEHRRVLVEALRCELVGHRGNRQGSAGRWVCRAEEGDSR